MLRKSVVILANSRKTGGRCLAGRELYAGIAGPWVRPVSDRPGEEVNYFERKYPDGAEPKLLDIASVPLIEHRPKSCQTENWLIEPNRWWKPEGRLGWSDLDQFSDSKGTLWLNGSASRYCQNNRVLLVNSDQFRTSLTMILVKKLEIQVMAPGEDFGNHRRRANGHFQWRKVDYGLRITDPEVEREYLAKPNGSYNIGECYLTISLGEPYDGFRYKLIAAVIERARTP